MRKLKVFDFISLDGFFEGPGQDISWHPVDSEHSAFAAAMLATCDMLLFGRITYQLMVDYWPTLDALQNDPLLAQSMNCIPKTVFSTTLENTQWHNTQLVRSGLRDAVTKMKNEYGGDITILGSGSLVSQLGAAGLIDEYQLMLAPLALGNGTPLFKDLPRPLKLELADSRLFDNGCMLLVYRVCGLSS